VIKKIYKKLGIGGIFVIISLIIPFINFNFTLDQALMPKFFLTSTLLVFFVGFVFYKLKEKSFFDTSILRKNIFLFYLGYVLIAFISIANATLVSEAIFDSLKNFLFLIFLIIGVLLLSKQKEFYKFISKAFCIFGIIAGIIGLFQIYNFLPEKHFSHQFTYLITATFAQRNLYAQILILSFPFAAFSIINIKGIWRWLGIIAATIELMLIILLLVRSVWIALALSSFLSVILLFIFYKKFHINLKAIRNLLLISLAFVLIILSSLFIYSKLDSSDTLKKQAYWLNYNPFGSVKERVDMWQYSVEMFKENHVLGVGSANWKIVLPKYASEEIRDVDNNVYTNFQRAHNDFLQVAAENGILGLSFYLLIFLCALFYIFRIIKTSEKQDEKLFALFMFFGIVSYLVISFFSFTKERISHSIIINLIFISITILYHKSRKSNKNFKPQILKLILIPVFLILIFALIFGINRIKGEKHTRKAYEYRLRNNHKGVIREIEKASSFFYQIDPISTPIKWYSGTAWFLSGNLNKAFDDFNESYKINPFHKHIINDLATSYELMGKHKMSEKLYKEAISLSPHFDEALINLSIVKYNAGKIDSAYNYLRDCKPDTENEKYFDVLKVILPIITKKHIEEMSDEVLKNTFYRFLELEEWMLKIHKQSVIEKRKYNLQLINEAIYLLEEIDSTITTEKAENYSKNYGL